MRYLSKIKTRLFGFGLCENVNGTNFARTCLLVYVALPFRSKSIDLGHQNQWQAKELARIVGEFGYNVDVINFNEQVKLKKKYDLVIDIHPGINRSYLGHTNSGCSKIAYLTGSNPSFANSAEVQRIEDLYQRKGQRVVPRRQTPLLSREDLASFNGVMFIGNGYNLKTYRDLNLKNVHHIVNTGYPFLSDLPTSGKCPRSFLFLGSGGQVHKGLDLLLDVFSQHPELELYVCSSFSSEEDFCQVYGHELSNCSNIHPVGFVDIKSDAFREICGKCSYLILPSCSEANAGSVLTGMSAGLIPVVSRECGFEEGEVFYLDDCNCQSIAAKVDELSKKPLEWVQKESQRAAEIVKLRYSQEHYTASVRAALRGILPAEVVEGASC